MKICHIRPVGIRRSRLARLALSSTLVCGLGLATAHGQEIGDDLGGDAGSTVQDQLSPSGQPQADQRGAVQRGVDEARRALGEGQNVEQSLRRGAGEAIRGAGEQISGQQLQEQFGGDIPQQYQDRTMYRDDQGRIFYWNEQGQQVFLQGQAQGQAQFQDQGQAQFRGQGQAQMRGQARAQQQGPTLGVAIQDSEQGAVEVLNVMEGTAAAEAGLQQGDRIVRINDMPVQSTEWLGQQINSMQAGEEVALAVIRDGQEQEITATLQESQRYEAQRPAMRGGQQADLSGLRQQVQQLQQEIETLRQQIEEIKANGGAQGGAEADVQGEADAASPEQQPAESPEQQQRDQTGDQGELDLDAGLEADTEVEAGAEGETGAGVDAEAEAETDAEGAAQPGLGNNN